MALVSGASRGIGREIARQLAQQGVSVYAGVRKQKPTAFSPDRSSTVSSYREIELDVTQAGSVDAATSRILEGSGRIDILVNNAGVSDGDHDALQLDPDKFREVMDVNVLGAWRLSEAVVPAMIRNNYGRIVNVSSTLGSLHHLNRPSEPAYRISKAAVNALTRVFATRLDGTGILVNAASPGWVRTDLGGPNAPRSVQQGADTPVWLATLPPDGPSGGFFYDRAPLEW
ncbi:NAD(P)-dependent dehydrogenase, short-chain alcohol dehydrogenase family [Amycolatopsis marina]|uniref:NAD(P)-dependent dehydrogenase, short-chain alcohol dehydrogenase family n=1 Tax=Amycolatopsis marina TaxID=490629 RepID=A0A1I1CRG0_9PSEU|nr:NAD(P)-dependent dehydrogenase, short-chain alcohol dehydrogenase family [Amycolatopsis marina]